MQGLSKWETRLKHDVQEMPGGHAATALSEEANAAAKSAATFRQTLAQKSGNEVLDDELSAEMKAFDSECKDIVKRMRAFHR